MTALILFWTIILIIGVFSGGDNDSNDKDKYDSENDSSGHKKSEQGKSYYQDSPNRLPELERQYGKILGLKGKVNRKEIHNAYKIKIKKYHPDKVASMADELKDIALERTKEINEAFEYFKKKYG
tara:strand:+ start:302 stop:676 length:375 start_codon:yes stop_codon:yes gene_type:complete